MCNYNACHMSSSSSSSTSSSSSCSDSGSDICGNRMIIVFALSLL